MAVPRDTTLTDNDTALSKVNGGTAIYMNVTNIDYKLKASVQADDVLAQDSATLTHNNLLPTGDSISIGVPEITITGVIDLGDFGQTANTVTLKFLQQIMKSGHKFLLTDVYSEPEGGDEDQTTYYRISTLSGTFPNETVGPVTVMAESLSLGSSTKSAKEGQRMDYTLVMKEVQS
jgi:hypothetical protein